MSRLTPENRARVAARAVALHRDTISLEGIAAAITAGADGHLAQRVSIRFVHTVLYECGAVVDPPRPIVRRAKRRTPAPQEIVELYRQIGWTDGVVLAVKARGGSVAARQVRAAMVAAGFRTKGAA